MDLLSAIEECGLSDHREAIAGLSRPCVTLAPVAGDKPKLSAISSHLGGIPHVRSGEVWPRWQDIPLSHLATINLADAASHDRSGLLPRDGLLRFWYVQDQSTWGFDPKDAGSFKVECLTDLRGLKIAELPSDAESYEACGIAFAAGCSVPRCDWIECYSPEHQHLADAPEYEKLLDLTASNGGHRLLGHASNVQGPMELECQLVSNGLYCGNPSGYEDPRCEILAEGALSWRLLLQLDSDDDGPGWMWGDVGRLYFWIREEDLRLRRFDQCWVVQQCY